MSEGSKAKRTKRSDSQPRATDTAVHAKLPAPGSAWDARETGDVLARVFAAAVNSPQRVRGSGGESVVMINEADFIALLDRLGEDLDMVDRFRASPIDGPVLKRPSSRPAGVSRRLDT